MSWLLVTVMRMSVISSFQQCEGLRLAEETSVYLITVSVLPTKHVTTRWVGLIPGVNYSDLRCRESQEQVFHSTDIDGDSYMRDDFKSTKAEIIC
ncbi:hypothetical protein ISN44_As07g027680 [Arabidopsis suecica]|uniref:Secreted protein n=1 Tax=Arabidopsis suecica TaxID=45249 RepID=A0A8T2BWJ1_ARASU|nr:hypothetical protein ISN44_As07g027680 [Arabidopsis suecica]